MSIAPAMRTAGPELHSQPQLVEVGEAGLEPPGPEGRRQDGSAAMVAGVLREEMEERQTLLTNMQRQKSSTRYELRVGAAVGDQLQASWVAYLEVEELEVHRPLGEPGA